VLLQLSVGTSNGFSTNLHGDVNNNVVNIKVLLSVSSVLLPFLMPDICGGKFLFFLPYQRKWTSKDTLLL